jgi:hypothetical protein
MSKKLFTTTFILSISTTALAESNFPSEEAFGKFIGQAAVQANISKEIQRICPNANLEPNLDEFLRNDFSKIPKLLDAFNQTTEQYKNLSLTLATELVNSQGGCDNEKFKDIEKNIQKENADIMIKWMQKNF